MIGIAALVVGIVIGLVFQPDVPEAVQPYLPIAVVAALDAVFGGCGLIWRRPSMRRSSWCLSSSTPQWRR